MSHVSHPEVHFHGLADGCPECASAAERPFAELDGAMLTGLIERTLRNRFGVPFGDYVAARSETEAYAMAVVMTALEHAGKLAETRPDLVALYLRERWRVVLPSEEGS